MLRRIAKLLAIAMLVALSGGVARAADVAVKSEFFTASDGLRLHYLEAGSGPGIVFEPGWSMPGWIWDAQIKHFAGHFHVVALDPRSQGDSGKNTFDNSMQRRARDIKELIEHTKVAPAVLVGWSLGVPELLTLAERFGGANVRAYVLVDGFAADKLDPSFASMMLATYVDLEANRKEFTEKFVRGMYRKPQPEDYIQRVVAASLQMPADSAIAASVSALGRAGWSAALAKLDRPVMVITRPEMKWMSADPVAAAVRGARVELFEDAGHALFVDDAERFNSVLDDFLQKLPKQ